MAQATPLSPVHGRITAVREYVRGADVAVAYTTGTTLIVTDTENFSELGGFISITSDDGTLAETAQYVAVDDSAPSITLSAGLVNDYPVDSHIEIIPFVRDKEAYVVRDDAPDEVIVARVPHRLFDALPEGVRAEGDSANLWGNGEAVIVNYDGTDWVVSDILDREMNLLTQNLFTRDGYEVGSTQALFAIGVDGALFYYQDVSTDAILMNSSNWDTTLAKPSGEASSDTYSFYATNPVYIFTWSFVQARNNSAVDIALRHRMQITYPSTGVVNGEYTSVYMPNNSNVYQVVNFHKFLLDQEGQYQFRWAYQVPDSTNRSFDIIDRKLIVAAFHATNTDEEPDWTQDALVRTAYRAIG